jgi:predicted O-linked N-acetylglucosamine transferase (SPINDLY family)
MDSIDLKIAALQNGSSTQAAENAPAPKLQAEGDVPAANQIPAASAPKGQQDTVSLSGTLPLQQRQQSAPSHGKVQPATFALLTQTSTFPSNHSTAAAFTTSALSPTASSSAGQNQASAVIATSPPSAAAANAIATSAAQTTAGTQSPIATATAGPGATASPTSAPSAAPPPQTLQQLDRVLQRLGVDPETLSLISKQGMVSWVNDPAALRQIVQNLRSAANSSQHNAAAGAANPDRNTAQQSIDSANQTQVQSQTQNHPQASAQETNPGSGSFSEVSSTNADALDQRAATAQQNAAAVIQFQKLQDSFARAPRRKPNPVPVQEAPQRRKGSCWTSPLSALPACKLFKLNHVWTYRFVVLLPHGWQCICLYWYKLLIAKGYNC